MQECGVAPEDMLIVIHDVPVVNQGLAGGRCAADADLGFRIDV